MAMIAWLPACGSRRNAAPVTATGADAATSSAETPHLRIYADPAGVGATILRGLCTDFGQANACEVEVIVPSIDSSTRLTEALRFLETRAAGVDVFQIDVTWPSLLAEHLEDLRPTLPPDGGG